MGAYAFYATNLTEQMDASGTAVARYAQGSGIDEPLAMLSGGVISFYHADGLGSVSFP